MFQVIEVLDKTVTYKYWFVNYCIKFPFMTWSGEHRALVVEEFLKNGESVVAMQNSLGRYFWRSRYVLVPTRKANTPVGFQLLTNHIEYKEKTS